VVCTVTVADPSVVPLRPTELGEMVQVEAGGAPLQVSEMV
jgi:hypothetical protein